ncbi:uncharacterized protein LOC123867385 [Maniola jurtina]|uniref:uncharacterized protein LOC123867385 n=1 Tax=Maniola jurtina TaxID=191418 RepID=UPI001E68BCA7|nr:uncharacterized protein LOC123867385 [Maniola jurtina]
MCLKYLLVLIYFIVHPGKTVAEAPIVSQEFEQDLSDLIVQYHKNNATEACETPAEKYINEKFIKSNLYEKFQLEKYFAEDSKCENLCLKVNYTIQENVANDNIVPIPVPKINDISTNPTVATDILPDITSKENASTDIASTATITITEGSFEDKTTIVTGGKEENLESSKNLTDSETESRTQENRSEGKKTAIIVAATMLAVGGTAVAAFFIYKGVTALLQSGTYVFPGSPNV